MAELLPFFIVIAAGLIFSEIFQRAHLPWVVSLIVGGLVIGPHGFDVLAPTPILEFLAGVGLVLLMFMAGLEVRLSSLREERRGLLLITLLNSLIPFLVALQIGLYFGYSLTTSLLLGAVFISSSIAVVIPSLTKHDLLRSRLGKTVLSVTVLEDILSLILLSVLLQTKLAITTIPLPIFYILVLVVVISLRWLVPYLQHRLLPRLFRAWHRQHGHDLLQKELRLVILMLIGMVIIFELLGLHPIIAGFFAGLVLSDSISSQRLYNKLRVISYGIFIPTFFVTIGLKTNLSLMVSAWSAFELSVAIVIGSLLTKFASGFFGAYISRFSFKESIVLGSATTPQLTTTLAVAFAALEFGLFNEQLAAALVLLSLVSTIVGPVAMSFGSRLLSK